jgi:hypothetical protein
MNRRLVLTVATVLTLAGLALSQAPLAAGDKKDDPFGFMPKPGPEHKMLAHSEGTWEAKVKSFMDPKKPPEESTGTTVRKMVLDGRFLQEHTKNKIMGKPFEGRGLTGYDALRKKYVRSWADNFGTSIILAYGTYDEKAKTLTFTYEEEIPKMGKYRARDVLKFVSDDEQVFEIYQQMGSEPEVKALEVTYTRKKS